MSDSDDRSLRLGTTVVIRSPYRLERHKVSLGSAQSEVATVALHLLTLPTSTAQSAVCYLLSIEHNHQSKILVEPVHQLSALQHQSDRHSHLH